MPDREADIIAADAAAAIAQAAQLGDQLSLFGEPERDQSDDEAAPARKVGRPVGAKNKAKSGLRELLIAYGYRDPGHMLARLAGLHMAEDAELTAIKRAHLIQSQTGIEARLERANDLLAKAITEGERKRAFDLVIDLERRAAKQADELATLTVQILKEMRHAAEAMQPYVHTKRAPDTLVQQSVHIGVAAPAGAPTQSLRSVGPPPMPQEKIKENQEVIEHVPAASDGKDRT